MTFMKKIKLPKTATKAVEMLRDARFSATGAELLMLWSSLPDKVRFDTVVMDYIDSIAPSIEAVDSDLLPMAHTVDRRRDFKDSIVLANGQMYPKKWDVALIVKDDYYYLGYDEPIGYHIPTGGILLYLNKPIDPAEKRAMSAKEDRYRNLVQFRKAVLGTLKHLSPKGMSWTVNDRGVSLKSGDAIEAKSIASKAGLGDRYEYTNWRNHTIPASLLGVADMAVGVGSPLWSALARVGAMDAQVLTGLETLLLPHFPDRWGKIDFGFLTRKPTDAQIRWSLASPGPLSSIPIKESDLERAQASLAAKGLVSAKTGKITPIGREELLALKDQGIQQILDGVERNVKSLWKHKDEPVHALYYVSKPEAAKPKAQSAARPRATIEQTIDKLVAAAKPTLGAAYEIPHTQRALIGAFRRLGARIIEHPINVSYVLVVAQKAPPKAKAYLSQPRKVLEAPGGWTSLTDFDRQFPNGNVSWRFADDDVFSFVAQMNVESKEDVQITAKASWWDAMMYHRLYKNAPFQKEVFDASFEDGIHQKPPGWRMETRRLIFSESIDRAVELSIFWKIHAKARSEGIDVEESSVMGLMKRVAKAEQRRAASERAFMKAAQQEMEKQAKKEAKPSPPAAAKKKTAKRAKAPQNAKENKVDTHSQLLALMGQMQVIRERIANAIKVGKAQSGIDVYKAGLNALQERAKALKAAMTGATSAAAPSDGMGVRIEIKDTVEKGAAERLRGGQSVWWLKTADGKFIEDAPKVEASEPFVVQIDLAPGLYVAGTGYKSKKNPNTPHVRVWMEVDAEGQVNVLGKSTQDAPSKTPEEFWAKKRGRKSSASAKPKAAAKAPAKARPKPAPTTPKEDPKLTKRGLKLVEAGRRALEKHTKTLNDSYKANTNTARRMRIQDNVRRGARRQAGIASLAIALGEAMGRGQAGVLSKVGNLRDVERLGELLRMACGRTKRPGEYCLYEDIKQEHLSKVAFKLEDLYEDKERKAFVRMGIDESNIDEAMAALFALNGNKPLEADPQALRQEKIARMTRKKIPGFFPSPPPVVDAIMAKLSGRYKAGDKALEPSAGMGQIAAALKDAGLSVDVAEFNHELRELLTEDGYNVIGSDALEVKGEYHVIAMNPPFERGADMDHVTYAFKNNLRAGGRLVAVMAAGVKSNSSKKHKAFRELVEVYGQMTDLPAGSFKPQTNVNTVLVVLDKPKGTGNDGGGPKTQPKAPEGWTVKEAEGGNIDLNQEVIAKKVRAGVYRVTLDYGTYTIKKGRDRWRKWEIFDGVGEGYASTGADTLDGAKAWIEGQIKERHAANIDLNGLSTARYGELKNLGTGVINLGNSVLETYPVDARPMRRRDYLKKQNEEGSPARYKRYLSDFISEHYPKAISAAYNMHQGVPSSPARLRSDRVEQWERLQQEKQAALSKALEFATKARAEDFAAKIKAGVASYDPWPGLSYNPKAGLSTDDIDDLLDDAYRKEIKENKKVGNYTSYSMQRLKHAERRPVASGKWHHLYRVTYEAKCGGSDRFGGTYGQHCGKAWLLMSVRENKLATQLYDTKAAGQDAVDALDLAFDRVADGATQALAWLSHRIFWTNHKIDRSLHRTPLSLDHESAFADGMLGKSDYLYALEGGRYFGQLLVNQRHGQWNVLSVKDVKERRAKKLRSIWLILHGWVSGHMLIDWVKVESGSSENITTLGEQWLKSGGGKVSDKQVLADLKPYFESLGLPTFDLEDITP